MQSAPKIIFAVIFAAFLAACGTNDPANSNATNRSAAQSNTANSNTIKDNADELETLVNIPVHPEEAVWREENKKLVAVLFYLKDDAAKVAAQVEKPGEGKPEILSTEPWFPAELIAQSQTSGDETIKGTSFPAKDFFNQTYTDGKITRIEGTDYFVLELYAK